MQSDINCGAELQGHDRCDRPADENQTLLAFQLAEALLVILDQMGDGSSGRLPEANPSQGNIWEENTGERFPQFVNVDNRSSFIEQSTSPL